MPVIFRVFGPPNPRLKFAASRMRAALALVGAALVAYSPARAAPTFAENFAQACATGAAPDLAAWRISGSLDRAVWPSRLTCGAAPEDAGALRIEVRPGDAYDPNPGDIPTERVEIQLKREVVKFEHPVWYSFRFRLTAPWPAVENRTVINQIKQNIAPADDIARGGTCPAANPFFKIETGYRDAVAGPAFVAKTRGTADCRDGKAASLFCGPWALRPDTWSRVNVALRASQRDSDLRVWLDGRPCPRIGGPLGYLDHGVRNEAGEPIVDTQPRFGIYRDALPGTPQAIEFADIAFWETAPAGDPAWAGMADSDAP
jgi:hypothetical protein